MRLRFRFSKLGRIRFTSQRDVARMWERSLRRAGVPLAYTEGFSPRPQLSFGLALPTGCESLAEYVDVRLDPLRAARMLAPGGPEGLAATLSGLLPEGVDVDGAAVVEAKGSLQELVTACTWTLEVAGVTVDRLTELVDGALRAGALPVARVRKGREVTDDLRPSVRSLVVVGDPGVGSAGGAAGLVAEVATKPRGVRPVELVQALAGGADGPVGPPTGSWWAGPNPPEGWPALVRACRTQQWIERDGHREEPLETSGPGREPLAAGCVPEHVP